MKVNDMKFSKEESDIVVSKVKKYFIEEFDYDIGGFEAEFSIEFFAKEIGPYFYNRGLSDAYSLFSEKAEEVGYLVQELEKPNLLVQ